MVGDHMGIRGAVGLFLQFFCLDLRRLSANRRVNVDCCACMRFCTAQSMAYNFARQWDLTIPCVKDSLHGRTRSNPRPNQGPKKVMDSIAQIMYVHTIRTPVQSKFEYRLIWRTFISTNSFSLTSARTLHYKFGWSALQKARRDRPWGLCPSIQEIRGQSPVRICMYTICTYCATFP